MTTGARVICAGRLYADLIFNGLPNMPELGTEVFCDGLVLHPGGGAVITAAYLARLGCDTELLTCIPADPFGQVLVEEIAKFDVGLAMSDRMPPDADPQVTVAMAHGGDRAFLTRRSGAAVPAEAERLIAHSGARHLHIAELATLVECPGLVTAARGAGMTLSLDCSWDSKVFTRDISGLIAAVDIFLPNAAEVAALLKAGLKEPFAPLTIVKHGADGTEAVSGTDRVLVPARPVEPVDTTGAGDAFDAGFLAAWLAGIDIGACLQEGNRAGAAAVANAGGMSGALTL